MVPLLRRLRDAPARSATRRGVRKTVTVLSADFAGSTAAARRMSGALVEYERKGPVPYAERTRALLAEL